MAGTGPSPLERELARRFETRTESFRHGAFAVELLLPRSADSLIDEAEFDRDERLPYWADLWPAARGLARHLLDSPPFPGPVLELGAGVALPSLALRWRGAAVLATDYYADALLFARANAERNAGGRGAPLPPLATRLLDWRAPPADLPRFPCVVAADVLYEPRNVDTLLGLLPRLLAPGGAALIADPGRAYLPAFRTAAAAAGWRLTDLPDRDEASSAGEQIRSRIRLLQLTREEGRGKREEWGAVPGSAPRPGSITP
jgi:ETFB lysine methyltransferase